MVNPNCDKCMNQMALNFSKLHGNYGEEIFYHIHSLKTFLREMYDNPSFQLSSSCCHPGVEEQVPEEIVMPISRYKEPSFPDVSIPPSRKIVTLCGSTSKALKFFQLANLLLTCNGFIVLSIGCDTHSDNDLELMNKMSATKEELELLHFDKIKMSDIVYVLNPLVFDEKKEKLRDYIGESTAKEVRFARALSKPIWWLNKHRCYDNCEI